MRTSDSRPDRGSRPRPSAVGVERRTRRDLIVTAVITATMIVVVGLVVGTGSAARSDFDVADDPQPEYGPALGAPTSLRALWSHESAGSGAPLTTKGNLVTIGSDGELVGRDAGSGERLWTYTHAGDLCAADFFADSLVAAFDGAAGCSDVTALDPTGQQYSSTRQSAFSDTMTLTSTWGHVLAMSPQRLEIWRDDLVRTVEYGAVDAPQEAGMQPRSGCTLLTADLTDERFGVSERCPDDDSVRLTLSETVPEDNRRPEEVASDVTGANGVWIIDVGDDGVLALTERGSRWAVEFFTGPTESTHVVDLPHAPAHLPGPETLSGDDVQARWFDGDATHAFDIVTGRHLWSTGGTTGPGHTLGHSPDPEDLTGRDLVILPVPGGFVVSDHASGAETTSLPATSVSDEGVTGLAQVGDILYERRDGAIHAYTMSD